MPEKFIFCLLVCLLTPLPPVRSSELEPQQMRTLTNWAPFVEADFPFFSSVLDARKLGEQWPTNNLTPRGLILNLGNGCWACFDTELLRMSAIWDGHGVTGVSLSQGSYNRPGHKTPEGQEKLPEIAGDPWMASGIYPGWQAGDSPSLSDPREPGPDRREVGRGPLSESQGRFKAIRLVERPAHFDRRKATMPGATPENALRKPQRTAVLRDASQGTQSPEYPPGFGVRQSSAAFWLGAETDRQVHSDPRSGVVLEYEVHGARVEEWVESIAGDSSRTIERHFRIADVRQPLWLLLGHAASGCHVTLRQDDSIAKASLHESEPDGCAKVRVAPSGSPIQFSILITRRLPTPAAANFESHHLSPVTTHINFGPPTNAFVVDQIPLPLDNPWRRNVRLADIAFFPNGRAAVVTFDGDVWLLDGLASSSGTVTWQRFASGLHEPLSLCIRKNELFVFDRNGIWRLVDNGGNGVADRYELFSNVFAQTAETREFASGMRLAPDGSFIIAKGGQEASTTGKLNGTVLRVSSDGKKFSVLGWGLRQPFIGVNPKTGLITASDQQGHYVPATPLHIIRNHQYYGFLPAFMPRERYPAPIADPLLWIPHPVNASGAGQVWLTGARMGPLTDSLIHIAYSRSELFLVRFNDHQRTDLVGNGGTPPSQAAVVSVTQNLDFAPLNGAVNPADGQLYVTGFQIWGSTAPRVSGLARLRYTREPCTLPREIAAMDKGVLLRFDLALDQNSATDPSNFSAERWCYKRTYQYGSPHYRLDRTPGQEWMTPSSAYLSRDHKSVFIGIPKMKPVMQMRVGWALATRAGTTFAQNTWLTPYTLTAFDPRKEGFERITVDLTPRPARVVATPVTVEEGQKLASLMGCVACHSVDGTTVGKVGPTWKGLFGSQVEFTGAEPAVADEAYLRESILDPTARIVQGFEKNDAGMPSYAGVLTDAQLEALIYYIKTLK